MRLTHYYLGYIELTPSIYYYRYNKFHGEYAIAGKLYNIKKICCSNVCYTTPRSIYIELIGGIKIRLKISIFYGEKVVHLADF